VPISAFWRERQEEYWGRRDLASKSQPATHNIPTTDFLANLMISYLEVSDVQVAACCKESSPSCGLTVLGKK
jgi:hypothetical protein